MADDRALVRAFRLLTYVHWTVGRFADAAAAAERTIRHATAAGDEVTARRFLGSLATSALYGPMPVSEAIATCDEVLARAQDDRRARALAELAIGHLEAMRGNFERARLLYRRQPGLARGGRLSSLSRLSRRWTRLSSSCSPGIWPPPSSSCGRTTGVLRRWASATTSRASLAFPAEPVVRASLAVLVEAGLPLSTAALEPHVDASRGRLEMMLKVLDTDGAVSAGWRRLGRHRGALGLRRRPVREGGGRASR